jgi:hypothetical protein
MMARMQDDNAAPVEADVRPSGEAPMLIGKSTIIFLVAAAMATPGIANARSKRTPPGHMPMKRECTNQAVVQAIHAGAPAHAT